MTYHFLTFARYFVRKLIIASYKLTSCSRKYHEAHRYRVGINAIHRTKWSIIIKSHKRCLKKVAIWRTVDWHFYIYYEKCTKVSKMLVDSSFATIMQFLCVWINLWFLFPCGNVEEWRYVIREYEILDISLPFADEWESELYLGNFLLPNFRNYMLKTYAHARNVLWFSKILKFW